MRNEPIDIEHRLAFFLKALESEGVCTRFYAVCSLGETRCQQAIEPLTTALGDTAPNIRRMAAYFLGELGSPLALDSLRECLEDDHPWVRARAAEALGKLADEESIPLLEALLEDQEELYWTFMNVGEVAGEAIARIKTTGPLLEIRLTRLPPVE